MFRAFVNLRNFEIELRNFEIELRNFEIELRNFEIELRNLKIAYRFLNCPPILKLSPTRVFAAIYFVDSRLYTRNIEIMM